MSLINMVAKSEEPPISEPQGPQTSRGVVFVANCENKEQANHVCNGVREYMNEQNIKGPLVVLGHQKGAESVLCIAEYLLQLFRQHDLEKNERELVLTHEDQLLSVQLCLAEYNKEHFGDFDVEASKVIETNNRLLDEKLKEVDASLGTTEYKDVKTQYCAFLKASNNLDLADVYVRLKDDLMNNENLQKQLIQTNFLFLEKPFGRIEETMASLLINSKRILHVQLEISLDQSLSDTCPSAPPPSLVIEPCSWEEAMERGLEPSSQMFSPGCRKSVTELYVEKILYSYLHLLVNSRSELALARVINVPDRGLDHKAFTEIKRYAKEKKLAMYQSVVSYIMRIRLGGSSYRPDPSSALSQHVKGLAEFTDLVHKLMTIIEENTDTRLAIRKVLNSIKNTVVKSKDNLLRKESVITAAEKIQQRAERTLDQIEANPQASPGRNSHNGGSMVGRQTLRVLRHIVDHHSSQPPSSKNMDVLTDGFSSQRTPLRFPSLMSQFRSPLEHSPEAKEALSLTERMIHKVQSEKKKKLGVIPRYQSALDWAAPVHNAGFTKEEPLLIDDFIPSKTIVHPAQCAPKPLKSRVLESMGDQENADSKLQSAKTFSDVRTSQHKLSSQQAPKPPVKRTLSDALSSQPAKKPKKGPAKKKTLALQKGQKQLTAFFRI